MRESKTNKMLSATKTKTIDAWTELTHAVNSKELWNFLYIEEKDEKATAYAKVLRVRIAKALDAMDKLTSALDNAPEF